MPRTLRRAAAALLLAAAPSLALAKPPTLTGLEPAGARQGTTVRVTASGSFEPWPSRAWCDAPGVSWEPAAEKGKYWVTVASGAPAGVHWVRVFNDDGASALRPFVVGSLPEVTEAEPNDDPAKAQFLDRAAVTVNGKLARNGDIDGFALPLAKGQTLVASVEANRRLGSPMDGLLEVARPDGIVLARNDDDHGRDPQLVFRAPEDGTYVVRVFAFPATPDSRIGYSGGEGYVYRLTLTTRGFVDHAEPLAVERDRPAPVRAEGWNLGDDAPPLALTPDAPGAPVAFATAPGLANVAEVRVVGHAATREAEPNPPATPQDVTPPVSVTGRIGEGADVDAYRFAARKGDRFLVRVESRALGQPLDPALRVLDPAGKVVAEADDTGRDSLDAQLTFTAPDDGAYRAVVRDLNRQGGPRSVYLLTVAPPVPEVTLKLASDRVALAPGKSVGVPVTIERANGADAVVEVTAEGLPDGVSAASAVSEPKGNSARSVTLTLKAADGVPAWSGSFRVVGRVKGDASGPGRVAEAPVEGFAATTRQPWLTLSKSAAVPKPAEPKKRR